MIKQSEKGPPKNTCSWYCVIGFLFASCGNVPQPFLPQGSSEVGLLGSPSAVGIGVIPLTEMNNEIAYDISRRIASALTELEIPSETVDRVGRLGYSLEGNIKESIISNEYTLVSLDWRLRDRRGSIVRRIGQTLQVNKYDWETRSIALRDLITQDIVAKVIGFVAPQVNTNTSQETVWDNLRITILAPPEAPGDGAISLSRTLANRMAQQGFKPAEDIADFIITGIVSVTLYDSIQDDITIVWTVLDRNENKVGEVRLDNRIPRGELDGPWGMVAEAVIDSSLPGILDIIAIDQADQTK